MGLKTAAGSLPPAAALSRGLPALPSGSGSTTRAIRVSGTHLLSANHPQHIFFGRVTGHFGTLRGNYRAVSVRPPKIAATPWPPAA